ncbi:UMP-CMP kinase 3-like protein [Drosera capensis]
MSLENLLGTHHRYLRVLGGCDYRNPKSDPIRVIGDRFFFSVWNRTTDREVGIVTVSVVCGGVDGPGSGKGTQCANIVEQFGYTHLSVGDLLHAEIKSGSENGYACFSVSNFSLPQCFMIEGDMLSFTQSDAVAILMLTECNTMIQNMIKEGKIVPSEVTIKLLQRAMQENGNDKFLIDGFPRNEENRAAFESVTGITPEFVLFFDCPEEEMERRLLGRNHAFSSSSSLVREDDNIETIRQRFKVYMESRLPVIEYCNSKGKVRKIDASKPVEAVFEDVKALFAPLHEKVVTDTVLW